MKVTFLGSGTSQGVPVIACDCKVCVSKDTRDKRLRSSIMLSHNDKNYVIDCGPDFRQQMLENKVNNLNAILFTHEHKDHVAGLDDVRAYNFKEKTDTILLRRVYWYSFSRLAAHLQNKCLDSSLKCPFSSSNQFYQIPSELLFFRKNLIWRLQLCHWLGL